MELRSKESLILLANVLLGTAILIFAVGFFPHKAVLPGLATWSSDAAVTGVHPPFDKVIFMVVDALRSDFVYGNASSFYFTQSLIRSGAAIPFTGHASPPTITMPRVKAITTGSVPSFIDLVLNFAESDTSSTLALQDSWLAQMNAKKGGKLVMFGDDTWLRLFPGFFARSDGTTSFFVSDFTEVDHNVTRNLPGELEKDDWSGMVLHYLGLDHIGHKTGPQGSHMPAKQTEMDGIIRQIYTAMDSNHHLQNSLLVLLGDHGMNEAGNHGASSSGETSTALTFISPKFKTVFSGVHSPVHGVTDFNYYETVEQSDIASTLAALLGFPIPRNSLGIIIPKILEMWPSDKDRTELMYANAEQVQAIARATFPDVFAGLQEMSCDQHTVLNEEGRLACEWKKVFQTRQTSGETKAGAVEIQDIQRFLKTAQSVLSGAASKYGIANMTLGIGFCLAATLFATFVTSKHIMNSGVAGITFLLVTLLYSITMFASSYVEEEHQFWYWGTAAWLVLLGAIARRHEKPYNTRAVIGNAVVCLLFGIARRWNQTGQKYAGDSDIVTELLTTNRWVLWTLVFMTYATVSRRLSQRARHWGSKRMAISPALVSVAAFLFKLAFTFADAPELLKGLEIVDSIQAFVSQFPLVSLARISFLGFVQVIIIAIICEKPWTGPEQKQKFLGSFHDVLSLFLITQTRITNVPLFLILYLQAGLLRSGQELDGLELTITSLMYQYSSFFMFGGTNAISSVDLSNAYNGIKGYNVVAVGFLTFVSNWAGPIWWTSASTCILNQRVASRSSGSRFAVLTLFASASTLAVMIACMVLREHLFIWTVFSPKYLYVLAWTFGQHFFVNGLFGTFVLGHR